MGNVEGCKTNIIYDGCNINASSACGRNEEFERRQNGQLLSKLPGSMCLVENADQTLSAAPCDDNDKHQIFKATADGQLVDMKGLCLTAAAPPSPSPGSS